MKRVAVLATCLAMGGAAHAAPGVDPAPCQRLVDLARGLPATAWARGLDALRPHLVIYPFAEPKPGLETNLAYSPAVRKAIGFDIGTPAIAAMPGSDLRAVQVVEGTLECQTVTFVRVEGVSAPRIVDPPPFFSNGLCWTQGGDVGEVFDKAAFIEHGALSEISDETDVQITPWTGSDWGPACRLALHFRPAFKRTEAFCGDQAVCDAADAVAVRLAAAYAAKRQNDADTTPFAFGPAPTPAAAAAVKAVQAAPNATETTPFPTFGAKAQTRFPGYSYTGFQLFPLTLDGRAYVAAIGYGGVGWRQTGDILLSVYAADGAALKPLAGLVIQRSVAGLASAQASPPKRVSTAGE
jgi:hypothetical protein